MSLQNKNITIHIGMPKCASTTLQKQVFSQLGNAIYCGQGSETDITKTIFDVLRQENIYFDFQKTEKKLIQLLNPDKPLIFSSENICAPDMPWTCMRTISRDVIAERLAKLAPQAKILLIIRNQLDLHKSNYSQFLTHERDILNYRKLSFRKWLDKNIWLEENHYQSAFQYADYANLVKIYKKHFSNVKVVIFEEIKKDMQAFINKEIKEFLAIDDPLFADSIEVKKLNKRHNMADIFASKVLGDMAKFAEKRLGNPQKALSKEKRREIVNNMVGIANRLSFTKIKTNYTQAHLEYLKNYYSKSNKEVSEILGVDLYKYNYPE